MVVNNLKYSAQTIAPNPKEIDYWVDLTEDPNGGIIKFWNGEIWDYLNRMDDQDRDIANEIARAKAAEQQLQENIDSEEQQRINADNQLRNSINQEIQDRTEADNEINETIDSIKIEKINNLQYELKINNVTVSTIDIPKDQYIKDIDYDADTNELIFVFETNTGEVTQRVDLSSLGLDVNTTYTFTDGTNGSFTVTSSDGITKVINIGKPATAGTADLALEVEWDNVENKPTTFAPSTHTHTISQITDFPLLADVATSGSYFDLTDAPAQYQLPIAGSSQLGGVKIGTGINIDDTGTISVTLDGSAADLSAFTNISIEQDDEKAELTFNKFNVLTGVAGTNVIANITCVDNSKAGLMSVSDKQKLDGIEVGATNYILPSATTTSLGGVKQAAAISDTIADGTQTAATVAITLNNLLAALRTAGILAS